MRSAFAYPSGTALHVPKRGTIIKTRIGALVVLSGLLTPALAATPSTSKAQSDGPSLKETESWVIDFLNSKEAALTVETYARRREAIINTDRYKRSFTVGDCVLRWSEDVASHGVLLNQGKEIDHSEHSDNSIDFKRIAKVHVQVYQSSSNNPKGVDPEYNSDGGRGMAEVWGIGFDKFGDEQATGDVLRVHELSVQHLEKALNHWRLLCAGRNAVGEKKSPF
jgi:hypothetical protein